MVRYGHQEDAATGFDKEPIMARHEKPQAEIPRR